MNCLLQIQRKPLFPTANSEKASASHCKFSPWALKIYGNSVFWELQIHGNTVHDAPRVKVFNLILCESLLCCHPLSDNYCAMHRQYFSAICATAFIIVCHSDLIKHSLCKMFSTDMARALSLMCHLHFTFLRVCYI